jgi:pimeloyl-ACP methyl ester carboxylesterase
MRIPPTRTRTVRGDGVDLHVQTAGDGPPVVLLHGFPESPHVWRHQLSPLVDAGFSVLVPEMRGYGRSGRPASVEAYRNERLVGDVAGLVRESGHARAHVVGHDWGGIVAWAFAAHHPDLLGRLVVMNAPHLALWAERVRRPPQMIRSLYAAAFQLPVVPEWVLAAGGFALLRQTIRAVHARQETLLEDDIDRYIAALRPPGALTAALNYYRALRLPGARAFGEAPTDAETLVVWGERDPALGLDLLDGLDRVAPNARVHRIPDAGHTVQVEAADEVNSVLVPFLQRAGPGALAKPDAQVS